MELPLSGAANASRRDEVAGDGAGGWLDLGSNDLRVLPAGRKTYAGVPFVVPDCPDVETRTCLVLGRRGEERAEISVSDGVRGGRLYLLHAVATDRAPELHEKVGTVKFRYADGSSREHKVRLGQDVGEWTSGREFENAVRAWTAYNDNTQVSLFISGFDLDHGRDLRSIRFKANGVCPWMVVAATAGWQATIKGLQSKRDLTGTYRSPPTRRAPLRRFPAGARPKNVILVVGDGMGAGIVRLTSLYQHGRDDALTMQQLPVAAICTTQPANAPVTDSAAAATAIATGHKTSCGVVGLGIVTGEDRKNPRPLVSVAAEAHAAGRAVALVTNDKITGATPAGFYAHVRGRGETARVVDQAAASGYEVLIGSSAGIKDFRPAGLGGSRQDARDVICEMEAAGYVCVTSQQAFAAAPRSAKVIGFFLEELQAEDSVAAAVATALGRVGDAPKGFFMMCESSLPDHGNHSNDPKRGVHGTLQVDWMAAAALDFAEGRDDTLVIVTADHETGAVAAVRSPVGGKVTAYYGATSHTAAPVALFAYGPGAECFEGLIDNTDIARTLLRLLASAGDR